MRLVLLLLLLPSVVMAEVPGVTLSYKDKAATIQLQSRQLVVGDDFVAVLSERPMVYRFDGKLIHELSTPVPNGFAFAGGHAYVAHMLGMTIFETEGWTESKQRAKPISALAATPDGRMIFARSEGLPGEIAYYIRDPKTGKLSPGKSFVESELTLARQRVAYKRAGKDIKVAPEATRIDNLVAPMDMTFSVDGKYLFVPCVGSYSLIVFERDKDDWQHAITISELRMDQKKVGVSMCRTVAMRGNDIFVGGLSQLGWLTFDGKVLSGKKYWTDDSNAAPGLNVLPFIEDASSLAVSKNGKYLFVPSRDTGSVAVMQIGKDDLTLIGMVTDSAAGAKMLEIAASGDKLFAVSSTNRLLIYDLDDRFTK